MIYFPLSLISFFAMAGIIGRKLYLISLISDEYLETRETFGEFLGRQFKKMIFVFDALFYKKLLLSVFEKIFVKMKIFFLKLHNISHNLSVKMKERLQNLEGKN